MPLVSSFVLLGPNERRLVGIEPQIHTDEEWRSFKFPFSVIGEVVSFLLVGFVCREKKKTKLDKSTTKRKHGTREIR